MKTYGGVEVQLHTFLTSALDGDEWSTSRTGCFTPRERARDSTAHWIGGWVGPRASLDEVMKRKFPVPAEIRTLDHPARVIPAPHVACYFKY